MDSPPRYTEIQTAGGSGIRRRQRHIIAIDFGTTYTGVAHLHPDNVKRPSLQPQEIAQNISLVQKWPDATEAAAQKIPTTLTLDAQGNVGTWGASATDGKVLRYFKLGLQPDAYRNTNGQPTDGFLASFGWNNAVANKSPLDLAADYLTQVVSYLHTTYFPDAFPGKFLKKQEFDYVVTVPAIWTDKAKDLTRQAAVRAGIPDDDIILITEPEAAALYCASMSQIMDLNVGDRFLICDVGGGTVVKSVIMVF